MNFPAELKYTKDHEWIRIEGSNGTIGITEYAQGELGDVVFVDIDSSLQEIKEGESFGTVEAVKTVSDLYAPVNGKVVEINPALADDPQLVNSDPYGAGWMIKVELTEPGQADSLLDAEAYKQLIGQ